MKRQLRERRWHMQMMSTFTVVVLSTIKYFVLFSVLLYCSLELAHVFILIVG